MDRSGIHFQPAGFTICHRGDHYGPFDYQFSQDLAGIEFLYRGDKFGECCNEEQFAADLSPYGLPITVCQVATIVLGTIAQDLLRGLSDVDRLARIDLELRRQGCDRYADGLRYSTDPN